MHQRTRLQAFAVIPCLALGLLAQETAPDPAPAPAETVQVAAHSSRWDYPKEVTLASGTQLHVVEKGDTLWDLGTKYLGNPFAWPQIWELNKWVKDPHWIYPGDPLLVDGSRGSVATRGGDMIPTEVANLRPDIRRTTKPVPDEYGYSFQDFLQLPYVAAPNAETYLKAARGLKIVGRRDKGKQMLGDGDFLYLNGGTNQGFKAGDRLVTCRIQARKFYHPDDPHRRKALGDIMQQTGVIRITVTYPEHAVAIIERSLEGILEGQFASPFVEPAHLLAKLRNDTGSPVTIQEPQPKVIFIREDKAVAAGGDLMVLDRGARDGLKMGDVLLALRMSPLDSSNTGKNAPMTNFYVGQVMVVRTEDQTATCRLLRSTEEVMVGDLLTR